MLTRTEMHFIEPRDRFSYCEVCLSHSGTVPKRQNIP